MTDLEGRWASAEDGPRLTTFRCANESGSPAHNVEGWVQHGLLAWEAARKSARVRLYFHGEKLVAVVAFCDHVEGHPELGYFIYLTAIDQGYQGLGLGKVIAKGLFDYFSAQRSRPRVYWMVDPANHHSIALAEALGCGDPSYDDDGLMLEYALQLP